MAFGQFFRMIYICILQNPKATYLLTSFLLIVTIAYVALMVFYALAWREMPESVLNADYTCKSTVSVIVPARNEAENLKILIPLLLSQQYTGPPIEIIVVNDHSTDATLEVLNGFSNKIRIIDLQKILPEGAILSAYKKKAIELAIERASGDFIICTDADCTMQAKWVENLVQTHELTKAKFIAAPVTYTPKWNWIGIFESIDFLTMQGITGASIYRNFNSTCNGANLAYSKKTFNAVGGFQGIDHIASGDDMLLMHKIERKFPRAAFFIKNKSAIVSTKPMGTLRGFLQQRIRWASKSKYYADKRVLWVLGAVYFFNVLHLFSIVACLTGIYSLKIYLIFICVKILAELSLLLQVLHFYKRKALALFFIPLQPVHMLYMVLVGFLGLIKKYDWKGRSVR